MTNVQVKLEFGHKARMKSKISPDGFTHEWTVFVRGPDGCEIQHFVEKVVFQLHESFPKPRRVVKEPPYVVSESGYAGFLIPIEIYFKQKEEPKKISFNYDLILLMEENQQTTYRLEKITIQHPSDEFREKLLRGGGVVVGPNGEVVKSHSSSKPKSLPPAVTAQATPAQSAPPPSASEADLSKKAKDVPKVTESSALFETIDAAMKKPKPPKPPEPATKVRTDTASLQSGSVSKASSNSDSRPKNLPIASKPATSLSSSSSSTSSKLFKPSATSTNAVQSPNVEKAGFSLADFVKHPDSGTRDAKSSSPSEEGSVKAASHNGDDRQHHKKAKHKKHKHEKHGHKRRLSDSDDDDPVPAKNVKTSSGTVGGSAVGSGITPVKVKDEKVAPPVEKEKEKTVATAALSKPKTLKDEHKGGSLSEKKERPDDGKLSTAVNDSKKSSSKPEAAAGARDDKTKSSDKHEKSSSKKPDIVDPKVKLDDSSTPSNLKPLTSNAVGSPSTTPVKDKLASDASKKSSKPPVLSGSSAQVKLEYTAEMKSEKLSRSSEEKSSNSSVNLKVKPPEGDRERKISDSQTAVPAAAVAKNPLVVKSSVPDVKASSSTRPLTLSDDDEDDDDRISTKSDSKREQLSVPAKLGTGSDSALSRLGTAATVENLEKDSDDTERKKKKKKKHKHKEEARELEEQPRPKIKIVQLEEPMSKDHSRSTPKDLESSSAGHRDVGNTSGITTAASMAAELNGDDDSNDADNDKMTWLPGSQLLPSGSGNLMNLRGVLNSFSDDVLNSPTPTSAALERTWGDTLITSALEPRSSELWNDASRLSRRLPSSGNSGRNGLSAENDEEGASLPLPRQLDLLPWPSSGLQGPSSASLRQDSFSSPHLALNGAFGGHDLGFDGDESDDFDGVAPNGERFSALVDLQRAIMMTNDRSLLLKVIELIKRTGQYSVSNGHMFDFDLCKLDLATVNLLRNFIRSAS